MKFINRFITISKNIYKFMLPILLMASSFIYAETSGLKFMDTDISARSFGMGQAFCAVTNDVNGLFSNPAMLNYVIYPEVTTMYRQGLMDSFYSSAGFLIPGNKERGALGMAAFLFDGGNIELNYLNGAQETVKLEQDWVVNAGYGKNVDENIFYGGNIKLINSQLAGQYNANGIAVDVGILVRSSDDKFSYAVVAQNLGSGLKYKNSIENFPTVLRGGIAYCVFDENDKSLLIAGDVIRDRKQNTKYNLGLEYEFLKILVLRAGYKVGYNPNTYSLGLGVKMLSGTLDYAYVPILNENTHRISFTMKLGSQNPYNIAEGYYKKGMLERAIVNWKKIRSGDTDYKVAAIRIKKVQTELAVVYLKKGQKCFQELSWESAINWFEKALELDSTNKEISNHLKIAKHCAKTEKYISLYEWDNALNELKIVLIDEPNNKIVLDMYNKAKTEKELQIKKEVENCLVMAKEELTNKNWDKSIQLWKKVLELDSRNDKAIAGLKETRIARKREMTGYQPAPQITSISPMKGSPGTRVNIEGRNFDIDTEANNVLFGNISAEVIKSDKNNLVVRIPGTAEVGRAKVEVQTYGGSSNQTEFFVVSGKPPFMSISDLSFMDENGDKILYAEEKGKIVFNIANAKGAGTAFGLTVKAIPPEKTDISVVDNVLVGDLQPGEQKSVEIPLKAGLNVESNDVVFVINIKEVTGMNPDSVQIKFTTHKLEPPDIQVAKFEIDDGLYPDKPDKLCVGNNNGIIEPGESVEFLVTLMNKGTGNSKNTFVKISWDNPSISYVTNAEQTIPEFNLGDIRPGEWKDIKYVLRVNKPYQGPDELVLNVNVNDTRKQFNKAIPLNIALGKSYSRIQMVEVKGKAIETSSVEMPTFGDELLKVPATKTVNNDAVGVIVGIRDYKNKDVPSVEYAINDAQLMKEYLVKVLGYREGNIIYLENPTKGDFERVFGTRDNHMGQLNNYVKSGVSDVFIYYTGHGAPDLDTNKAYFVPADCHPDYVKLNGYSVELFYDNVKKIPAKSVTMVIDACFSGSSQKGMILAKASSITVVQRPTMPGGMDTFTSTSKEEVASWYTEKQHSLFTYFFLKALQGDADKNQDKNLTLGEIKEYITENVPYLARRMYNRNQTPEFNGDENKILVKY